MILASISKLNYHVTIKALLLLPAIGILVIPLTNTNVSPVFGQAFPPQDAGMGGFGLNPVPSINPFDLSGLGTAGVYGLTDAGAFPPTSAPLELPQAPLSSFPPSTSAMPSLGPAFNGQNNLPLGAMVPDSSGAFGPSSPLAGSPLPLSSPVPSAEASSSTPVTIHACMDPASGNIPVNSIGSSSANGCLFQAVPVVITMDEATNMISTCFVAPDLVTPMGNCITSTPSLQLQQQQSPVSLTLPFQ